jgi:ubiquitin C-terminal hydrolase
VWTHAIAALEQEAGLTDVPYPTFSSFKTNDVAEVLKQTKVCLKQHRQNVIRSIFGTFIVTTQCCQSCNNQSHSPELFQLVNLLIPELPISTAKLPLSLMTLITYKLKQSFVDEYACSCLEGKVDTFMRPLKTTCTETVKFASFPSVILFFLQRAIPGSATRREQKSFQKVIPEEFLELTSLNEDLQKFVLVSVSIHDGKDDGGHYVTLSRFKDKYYFFNDIGSVRRETTLEAAFGDKPPFYVDLSRNSLIFYYAKVVVLEEMDEE